MPIDELLDWSCSSMDKGFGCERRKWIEAKEILLGSSVEITELRSILEYKSQATSEGWGPVAVGCWPHGTEQLTLSLKRGGFFHSLIYMASTLSYMWLSLCQCCAHAGTSNWLGPSHKHVFSPAWETGVYVHSTWEILLSQQEVQKVVSQEINGWSIQQANMKMEEIQQKDDEGF